MARINLNSNDTIIITDNKEVSDMTLTIKGFADAIASKINDIQEMYKAEVTEVVKMNDQILYGVQMKEDGKNSAPTIYVNEAYEDYEDDCCTVEEVAHSFIAHAMFSDTPDSLPTKQFDFSLQNIKDKLSVRLIGVDRNKIFRQHIPVFDMDNGLGLIADVNFNDEYRTTITDKLMDDVGCDIPKLFKTALINAEKYDHAVFKSMGATLFSNHADNLLNVSDYDWEDDGEMYVLTTESGTFGAAAMYYDGVLEKIADIFGVSFFVLPYSVHELIVLPDTGSHNVDDLKKMVYQANRTVVDEKDILSDDVYYYSYAFGSLSVA